MNRIYSLLMFMLGAILLLIFHSGQLGQLWDTDTQLTGQHLQISFFRKLAEPTSTQILNGRRLKSNNQEVVYQFTQPPNSKIYLMPAVVKQSGLMDQEHKLFSYKNLKSLRLRLPKGAETSLFHSAREVPKRLNLSAYLKDAPVFQLVLDNSDDYSHSEHVIGSLDFYLVTTPPEGATPKLPLFCALLVAPIIFAWFFNAGLDLSLASSLGLAGIFLLALHLLGLFQPQLLPIAVIASLISALLILGLRALFEKKAPPLSPFFWSILLWGMALRWHEIMIQGTRALDTLPLSQQSYQYALSMELFTDHGFFSSALPQSPLYPLLLKLNGMVLGFSGLHMFYVSLMGGLFLLVLAYAFSYQLLGSRYKALLLMALLCVNPFLVQESGLRTPAIFGACFSILYLIIMFSNFKLPYFRALVRAIILLLLVWNTLSFIALACGLLLLDICYQVLRTSPTAKWGKSIRSGLLSLILLFAGFAPCLMNNWANYTSVLPESTYYVSRVANLEFSDQRGFPNSLDVMRRGQQAQSYRIMGLREYFFEHHKPLELLSAGALGLALIVLDGLASVLQSTKGENILSTLVYGLSSQQNLLPILSLFIFEIMVGLLLFVFAWRRFYRYRVLLGVLLLFMLPHSFFYGILMLKGISVLQSQLDHQMLILWTTLISVLLLDACHWILIRRQRWLR